MKNIASSFLYDRTLTSLLLLLLFAVAIRLLLFNGPMGSDDITYIARAIEVSSNIWTSADYNGALRYGFNIPAGFFIYLFGPSVWSANLWPFLCSVAEIALVYWIAGRIFDAKTAFYSALLLATTPLHVAAATRIHVDPVVSSFITLSFVLFFRGYSEDRPLWYFLTGLATGFVFWCRELVILYLVGFVFFPLFVKVNLKNYLWFYIGGFVMLFSHIFLMWLVNGDPLHFFNVVFGQIDKDFVHGDKDDAWTLYFYYLFMKPVHTWLLGILALGGIVALVRQGKVTSSGYVIFWALFLILLFSITPISFSPFRFITKQSNYIIMFLAPLAILGGHLLSKINTKAMTPVLLVVIAGNLVFSALEQQVIRAFVANGNALAKFVGNYGSPITVYASVNNANIAAIASMTSDRDTWLGEVRNLAVLESEPPRRMAEQSDRLVFVDPATLGWSKSDLKLNQIPQCWVALDELQPDGFGLAHKLTKTMLFLASISNFVPDGVSTVIRGYHEPQPGTLYKIPKDDPWCGNPPSLTEAGSRNDAAFASI